MCASSNPWERFDLSDWKVVCKLDDIPAPGHIS